MDEVILQLVGNVRLAVLQELQQCTDEWSNSNGRGLLLCVSWIGSWIIAMVCLINSNNSDDDVMVLQQCKNWNYEISAVEGNDESAAINFWCHHQNSKFCFLLKPKSCQISALRKLAINFFWCHHQKFKIGIYLSPQVLSNVSAEKIGHHFFWCHHWKFKISIYLSPSLVKYLNRKKKPNRNFNIPAQRTQIGKYKSNTYDYLKLNKTIMKVISKLCYNITYQS